MEMVGAGAGGAENSRVQGSREIRLLHVYHMPDAVFGAFHLVSSLLLTRTLGGAVIDTIHADEETSGNRQRGRNPRPHPDKKQLPT